MTGKNSCQTIRHHPARVPSSSSFVSLLPRASAPSLPPLRVDTFESWNSPYKRKIDESFLSERRSYPRMRRAGEEYSRKSCSQNSILLSPHPISQISILFRNSLLREFHSSNETLDLKRKRENRRRDDSMEKEEKKEEGIESGAIDRIGERLNRFVRKLKSQVAN